MSLATTITARLGLDTKPFADGFRNAGRIAESRGASMGKSFVTKFHGALAGLGIAAVVERAVSFGVEAFHEFANVADLAQRLNISTDAVQSFGAAADESGSSMAEMANGFHKLLVNQSKALGGNKELIESFYRLGVTMNDLRNLSPEQLMLKLAHSSLNVADTVAVLGKSGDALIPTLRGIADGSVQLGKVLDKDIIARIDEADDTIKRWTRNAKVAFVEVGAAWVKNIEQNIEGTKDIVDAFKTGDISKIWKAMGKPLPKDSGTKDADKSPDQQKSDRVKEIDKLLANARVTGAPEDAFEKDMLLGERRRLTAPPQGPPLTGRPEDIDAGKVKLRDVPKAPAQNFPPPPDPLALQGMVQGVNSSRSEMLIAQLIPLLGDIKANTAKGSDGPRHK